MSCCARRIGFPLLVQGPDRQQLLSRFRALGNAVLLGSSPSGSVDWRGEAFIRGGDRQLPFAPPDIPCLPRAREHPRRGGNPFTNCNCRNVLQLKHRRRALIRARPTAAS